MAKKPKETMTHFMMAAVQAIYIKEDQQRQRHMNVLIDSPDGVITRSHLKQLQEAAMTRLKAENDVEPGQVKDVVIMSISNLGFMAPSVFHGTPETLNA